MFTYVENSITKNDIEFDSETTVTEYVFNIITQENTGGVLTFFWVHSPTDVITLAIFKTTLLDTFSGDPDFGLSDTDIETMYNEIY